MILCKLPVRFMATSRVTKSHNVVHFPLMQAEGFYTTASHAHTGTHLQTLHGSQNYQAEYFTPKVLSNPKYGILR